jgi:ABC-type multidrug transport system ATPase subunit
MDVNLDLKCRQFGVLMKKNGKLAMRSWGITLLQILPPILFVLFLLVLSVVPHVSNPTDSNPKSSEIEAVPRCVEGTRNKTFCISLAYAPSTSDVVSSLMSRLAIASNLSLFSSISEANESGGVVGFRDQFALHRFVLDNANVTQGAVVFAGLDDSLADYTIWWNNTCTFDFTPLGTVCPDIRDNVQVAVDTQILNAFGDADDDGRDESNAVELRVSSKPFPLISLTSYLNNTVKLYGALFFFAGSMFGFIVLMYQLAYEKAGRLKLGMQMMGLDPRIFWLSWLTTATIGNVVSTLLIIGTGAASQLLFFTDTSFGVLFVVFFSFQLAMMMLAVFVSVFIRSVTQSVTVGMLLFIIGTLIQFLASSPFWVPFVYGDATVGKALRYALTIYPPFHFTKMCYDISSVSFSVGNFEGPGYSWADLYKDGVPVLNGEFTPPPTVNAIWWMLADTVIFGALAWYCEHVFARDAGAAEHPLFFVMPSFWCRRNPCRHRRSTRGAAGYQPIADDNDYGGGDNDNDDGDDDEDSDVKDERARAMANEPASAVRLCNLHQIYRRWPFGIASKHDVHAVRGVSLCMDEGTITCLLGHNGAGKSTVINMLTGILPPTRGDTFVFDHAISSDVDLVRDSIGICPQHDILWDELTPEEHLELFAVLKGLPSSSIASEVRERLESVELGRVGALRSATFSGGMKRRLSIAISSVGDPRLIVLDEPSTGCDVKVAQSVWKSIQRLKKGRVILLSTHSMIEADTLADKVAIMSQGRMKAVGTPLHLKDKFGDGYRLSIQAHRGVPSERIEQLFVDAKRELDDDRDDDEFELEAKLISHFGATYEFAIDKHTSQQTIDALLRHLESFNQDATPPPPFSDWGFSMVTLDSVFMRLTGSDFRAAAFDR